MFLFNQCDNKNYDFNHEKPVICYKFWKKNTEGNENWKMSKH